MEELPPALKAWNGKATEISGEYVFTPELFIGNGAYGNKTGIYVGNSIRTKFQGEWYNIAGMVGMENGEANWMFTHSGNFILGRKPGENIQLGADGRAIIPMIKSNMIEAGAITASKIKAGEITTDFLYPGQSKRIVLEPGYEPGSNDAMSIDANNNAIRLKYDSNNYISCSSGGVTAYYEGVRCFKTGGGYNGISVLAGTLMNLDNYKSNMNVRDDEFFVNCNGSTVLGANRNGVWGMGSYSVSDARLKENICKLDCDRVTFKNTNVENENFTSEEIFKFIKELSLFNYNFKDDTSLHVSPITQTITGKFKDTLVGKNKGKYALETYNYTAFIHSALQSEIKKREALEDKVSKLEEELGGIKKLLKERGIE